MKKLSLFFLFSWLFTGIIFAQNPCYLIVEKSANYDPGTVSSLSMTLISQYVAKVEKIPSGGINRDACSYYVTLAGSEGDLVLSLSGTDLNAVGNSKLKGTDGLTQSLLIAIYRSTSQQSTKQKICQTYSHLMTEECALAQNWQNQDSQQNQGQRQDQGNGKWQDQDNGQPSNNPGPPRRPRSQDQGDGQWKGQGDGQWKDQGDGQWKDQGNDQSQRNQPNRPRRPRNQNNQDNKQWQDQNNKPRNQQERWRMPKTKEEWGKFEKNLKKAIKKNPKGVIGNLTRELRKDPNHPVLLFYTGMAFFEDRNQEKALRALKKSCKLDFRRACQQLKKIKARR